MALFEQNKTVYDKSTTVKYKGPKFNMSRLIRKDLGNGRYLYVTGDGVVVSDSSGKLTKNAWGYLASKYGKDYANRTSANMLNGHIWNKGRWYSPTKVANLKEFDNVYLTWANKSLRYNGSKGKIRSEASKQGWNDKDSFTGNIISGISRFLGYKPTDKGLLVANLGAYMIPGVGNFLSAADAVDYARKGEWGEAALSGLFALPVIGNVGKALRGATTLAKAGRNASRAAKVATKYSRPYKIGKSMENFAKSKPVRWTSGGIGLGMLAYNAPLLYGIGKMYGKEALYGDLYTQSMDYINDMKNLASEEEKKLIDELLKQEAINSVLANNALGYGYNDTESYKLGGRLILKHYTKSNKNEQINT